MQRILATGKRRTNVDEIFEYLHEKILMLDLKPGDKISEAEIAAMFGVSRQPVRDAFSRLANISLLLIRPQRATVVRRFSMRQIEKSRFVRAAIEKEVLLRAASRCDNEGAARLEEELKRQEATVETGDVKAFSPLDYRFHQTLCEIAGASYAFDVILEEKPKVDRLCMLALDKDRCIQDLVVDHRAIAQAVIDNNVIQAVELGMKHLSRLDETIERIRITNVNYFDLSNE